ncbi:Hcp family type VI secretion system effector [Rheinheimera sp. UJ63]|uniref:Hcp family type VI secretion system effector n=1 Tax=Rheinheimera sp. UJ63 TaxID=2910157 RepID=UPI001F2F632A|nr:type VI secretion system tube protein Hcp [Rheinheimera sp. UJ63]MCF4009171.1 type VI secretion system tube protein Hcp [Rheinheimera sp. UJ63]
MKTLNPLSKSLLTITTTASLLLMPIVSYAAVDMFLEIDGIVGESYDKDNRGAMDILAWSEGLSQSGSFQTGGGGAGKANFQDINFTKWLDSASPALRLSVANGQHIPTATLTVRRAGANPSQYFKIEMKNIIVTSVSSGGSGGDDRLTENITLNFAEVTWTYYPIDEGGNPKPPISVGWNIAENKQL